MKCGQRCCFFASGAPALSMTIGVKQMLQVSEESEFNSTYPPVQCAREEMTAHILPQLVPNHFESVGVRFAHAPRNASCLLGPEITCEGQKGNKESVWVAPSVKRDKSYFSVVEPDQNKEQNHRSVHGRFRGK